MGTSFKGIFTKTINKHILQTQLKTAQADTQPKFFNRACKADPRENEI